MTNFGSESDFQPRWIAELMATLLPALPLLEKLVAMGHHLHTKDATATKPLPCHSCTESNCNEHCERLRTFLGGDYQGRGRRENLTGFYPQNLRGKEIIRRIDIFEQYALWKDDFTANQWAVIELYYKEGMSEKQVSIKLSKARSTVNGLLNRAKKRKELRDKQLRRETRDQFKKNIENQQI